MLGAMAIISAVRKKDHSIASSSAPRSLCAGPGQTAFMKCAGGVAMLFALSLVLGGHGRLICYCTMACIILQLRLMHMACFEMICVLSLHVCLARGTGLVCPQGIVGTSAPAGQQALCLYLGWTSSTTTLMSR